MQRDSARSAIGAYNRKPPPAQSWGSLRTGSFCHAHIRFTYRIVRDSGQTSFALLVGGAPFHIADPDAIEACHRVLQPTACAMGAWGPKVVYILASPADRSRHYLPQAPHLRMPHIHALPRGRRLSLFVVHHRASLCAHASPCFDLGPRCRSHDTQTFTSILLVSLSNYILRSEIVSICLP